jgi:hypothetical protein
MPQISNRTRTVDFDGDTRASSAGPAHRDEVAIWICILEMTSRRLGQLKAVRDELPAAQTGCEGQRSHPATAAQSSRIHREMRRCTTYTRGNVQGSISVRLIEEQAAGGAARVGNLHDQHVCAVIGRARFDPVWQLSELLGTPIANRKDG